MNNSAYRVEIPMSEIYAVNDYFKQHGLVNEDQYFDLYRQSVEVLGGAGRYRRLDQAVYQGQGRFLREGRSAHPVVRGW
jgi:hypothetical protein